MSSRRALATDGAVVEWAGKPKENAPTNGGGPGGRPAWKATLRCIGEESMSYGRVSGELLPPATQRALSARKHAYGSRKRVNISFNSFNTACRASVDCCL